MENGHVIKMRVMPRGQLETASLILCSVLVMVLLVKVNDERRLEPRYIKYRDSTQGSTDERSYWEGNDVMEALNVNPGFYIKDNSASLRPDIASKERSKELKPNQSEYTNFPDFPRSIPNVYLHNITLSNYRNPLPTFLHNPKSGGTTLKKCLMTISEKENKKLIPFMTTDNRLDIEVGLLSGVYNWKSVDLAAGSVSMGICQNIDTPRRRCAYYTIVREPYDRIISHYFFCKGGGVTSLPCHNKTIEEYVMDVGSLFFRQLLFQVRCVRRRPEKTVEYRCFRNLSAENIEDIDELTNYLVGKLESFFAVIGLTEEYDTSLVLFQDVFKFQFYDDCRGLKFNTAPIASSNSAVKQRHELEKAEVKKRLLANEEIRRVLRPDVLLYEKAKEIFQQQKQLYMSKRGVDNM
ncbi:hypothetical protein HOLleu_16098 [Holothuria leucospilota]|uniref:Sulfotransferase n=1 Tax=Holothuria leucospilota TaxID=206669 RepID=A0A9Q1HAW6_HOLLE|nr:hypothetical protein HOLleu_16098 [Holothuria leucospilota]